MMLMNYQAKRAVCEENFASPDNSWLCAGLCAAACIPVCAGSGGTLLAVGTAFFTTTFYYGTCSEIEDP